MGANTTKTLHNRIDTIDVLRGFALTGILYAHMVIWYTGAALPAEVYLKYDSTADGLALGIFGALVFGKFFSVFSFLFGLSFFLNFRKHESEHNYLRVYLWRLFLLFLIGMVHHIFWRGDILTIYAVLGFVLLFFRNLSPKIILAMGLLLITNVPVHIYEAFNTQILIAETEFPMAEQSEVYYSLVKNEGLIAVLKDNWGSWPSKIEYQLESGRLLMTFGYFLLGLYAGRVELFTSISRNISRFKFWNTSTGRAVLVLLSIGWLMYLFDLVTIPGIKVVPEVKWLASFLFSIYNAGLTIFYITGITLLFRLEVFHFYLKPFAALGKMALTNYLLQTIFGLLLFYHFGLGFFDRTTPAVNVFLGIIIFYIQLKLSQLWLKHFVQGPVEWLWKALTYLKFNSNKRQEQFRPNYVEVEK